MSCLCCYVRRQMFLTLSINIYYYTSTSKAAFVTLEILQTQYLIIEYFTTGICEGNIRIQNVFLSDLQ